MITINATLVVQMANFLCMWWFLDRFFFRLFVREIQREQAALSMLIRDVQNEHSIVLKEEATRQREWEQYQVLFSKKIPIEQITPVATFVIKDCFLVPELSQEDTKVVVNTIRQSIVKQVIRGF